MRREEGRIRSGLSGRKYGCVGVSSGFEMGIFQIAPGTPYRKGLGIAPDSLAYIYMT